MVRVSPSSLAVRILISMGVQSAAHEFLLVYRENYWENKNRDYIFLLGKVTLGKIRHGEHENRERNAYR